MENNTSALALTVSPGDSILLEGKDKIEIVFKRRIGSAKGLLVVIADKSVVVLRKKLKDQEGE